MIERLLDLIWAADEAMVDEVIPWEHGTALSTPELPLIWDLNALRVESDPGDAATVVAAADRHQGAYNWRKAVVRDGALAGRLAPELAELGWATHRQIAGLWRGGRPEVPPGAGEVDAAVADDFRALTRREEGSEEELVRQMTEMDARATRALEARDFCAPADGEPQSGCRLQKLDDVAQIENVWTRPSARGRGLARTVVLSAVDAALAAGYEEVCIFADAGEWPGEWYERLGFEPVGSLWEFMPARAPA